MMKRKWYNNCKFIGEETSKNIKMIKSLKLLLSGAFSNTVVKRGNSQLDKKSNIQESCRLAGPFCLSSVRGELSVLAETWGIPTPFLICSKVIHPEMYLKPPKTVSRKRWDIAGLHCPIPSRGSHCPHLPPDNIWLQAENPPPPPSNRLNPVCSWLHRCLIPVFQKRLWNYSCWEYKSVSHTVKQHLVTGPVQITAECISAVFAIKVEKETKQFVSPGRTRDGSSGPCEQLVL